MTAEGMNEMDRAAVRKMIEAGALIRVETEKLPKLGWGKVFCGDGDETPFAIRDHIRRFREANGMTVCAHIITMNGGPAAACPASPFNKLKSPRGGEVNQADYLLGQIDGMLIVKNKNKDRPKVRNIGLVPHCQCGLCEETGTSVWENILYCIAVKDMVRKTFPKTFSHHKIMPRINFTGLVEANHKNGPYWDMLLVRPVFERLAEREGIV